jgi:ferredoxin
MNRSTPSWPLPVIALERCTGCGLCQQRCPTQAVEVHAGRAVIVRPEACTFCEVCESLCPSGAIGRPFRIVFATETPRSSFLDL